MKWIIFLKMCRYVTFLEFELVVVVYQLLNYRYVISIIIYKNSFIQI